MMNKKYYLSIDNDTFTTRHVFDDVRNLGKRVESTLLSGLPRMTGANESLTFKIRVIFEKDEEDYANEQMCDEYGSNEMTEMAKKGND